MHPTLFSVREFCTRYGVGRTKAYDLLAQGVIQAVRVGARTMITVDSAEAWATSLPRFVSTAAAAREARR